MINNNLTKNIRMKKMMCFSKGVAVLALGLVVASCSKMDDVYRQLSEEEAVAHAEEVLDMEIDPNKDWNMTRNGSMTITANAGINTTEVLILDAYPFGNADAKILGQAKANEGETVTIDYIAPKGLQAVYVACRNAKNDYRVRYATIDTEEVVFNAANKAPRRAEVASPSITEVGFTFNGELAQAWNGVVAAEETGTDGISTFNFMGGFVPWKNSGWSDKYYQINASVVDSEISDQEASDIAAAIMTEIPEGANNLTKAVSTGYSIVTTGGPVTLTPIFHNSNSGDKISYYYYPEGTTPTVAQIKAMKKYTIGEMSDPQNNGNSHFFKKTYSLVYEDENENVSYDFPEGYVINFIISNTYQRTANKDVYVSGGITTTTTTTTSPTYTDELIVRRALAADDVMECGSWKWRYEQIETRFGRSDWYDRWSNDRGNAPENPYANFAAAKSSSFGNYSAYTEGNGTNGSLTANGATTYFLKLNHEYRSNLYAKVAISLNPGKGLTIYELDDFSSTTGTIVGDYNNKTYTEKNNLVEFPITVGKVYAIYANGSKLGFYGWEVVTRKVEGGETTTTTTVSDVVTKRIFNHPDYYGDGRMNQEVHQSGDWGFNDYSHGIEEPQTPHCAVYSIGDKTYVGFEDWVDFDYNDVIYEIIGAEGGEEITVEDVEKPIYTYAFEDTNGGDYDMNDVVIRARESADGTKMILKFVAAGATLDLNVRLYPNAGADGMTYGETFKVLDRNGKTEIHEMFNADHGYMINTNGGDANCASATPFEIEIDKATYGITDASKLRLAIYAPQHNVEMRLSGAGTMPYGLIVPGNWKWPQEYINIKRAYSNKNTNETEADQSFENYGSRHDDNQEHAVWWFMYPTDNLVMDESDLPK